MAKRNVLDATINKERKKRKPSNIDDQMRSSRGPVLISREIRDKLIYPHLNKTLTYTQYIL